MGGGLLDLDVVGDVIDDVLGGLMEDITALV